MSDFVQQQSVECRFESFDSWVILSPIEQSIKRKIESVGTPLKDWDIQINYGIKTGFNDAFIISTEKRNEILDNCSSEEERTKTAELIRPILRGRDIKRYGYDWANLWIINTHNGIKGVKPRIDINEYPAVKAHLDQYWDKISKRADKGDTPYNLRNCAYLDLFFQPKICWKAVGRNLAFSIVESGTFLTAPASFISAGIYNEYILAFLCSNVGTYFIYKNSDTTGAGDIMLNIQSLIKFPIPLNQTISIGESINVVNQSIYQAYGFTSDEISYIESSI
ncbi:TaqI-like C-terminal specificity domain-containing protein [Parabacteroides merdae]|uniref:TaqI-like C-terminal specificity domain-containing protein n=1 Tax=Parabacteroides merdae TaxID=46503 RepID=UPI00189BEE25|nr:TaqI-like C-terminal specificity domain-containing protein [Parabacteroides merdae]